MATKEELMLKKADYVLVVNKDFEIVYNSRFDSNMGGAQDSKEYKHFFDMYPSLAKNNSSIARTMSTGVTVFNDAQEFVDINGQVYVTQNLTIPVFHEGQVCGVVELTKDLTTVGDAESREDYLSVAHLPGGGGDPGTSLLADVGLTVQGLAHGGDGDAAPLGDVFHGYHRQSLADS